YILHGIGQPLHCFDLAKIEGGKVVVRTCPEGTKFTTLDGVERTLDSRDLMICNAKDPMCIAGVFGGLDSGVTEATTDIFIESAYFNPTWVRKTARRHGLSTDSSFRYERGTDPNATLWAAKFAAMLVKELAGGEICGEPVDIYPEKISPYEVEFDYDYARRLIGKDIEREVMDSIMKSLEIEIAKPGDKVSEVLVPTYRVDVRRPCDVVEDILRIYGYNNVETGTSVRSALSSKSRADVDNTLRNIIGEQLTAVGFNEILNNSLTSESYYADLSGYPLDTCVRLLNPLSSDLAVMRRTLLFGGLESLAHNINRKQGDLLMYEFGNVYARNPHAESTAEKPLAPYSEGSRLGIWLTGALRPGNWARPQADATFFDLKATVANIFARLGISEREIKLSKGTDELFDACIAISTRSGKELGVMGIVAKKQLARFDIKQQVVFAELDWAALVNLVAKRSPLYTPLPRTQPVRRDLALLIDNTVTMEQVEATVRESERKLLQGVELFDVYEGKNLPEGKKSYAVAITLQDNEKTLTDKQIESVMEKITANLSKKLGASLR
ncbi:MAG: phenylalanine--tRNA ligase subunit beta, partial [Paramuribaculum sp.]|nr:phenylalanine--tRNA ligase subunit beta [Paramuribaculum sp.]